jgi:hypothetical protein
MYVVDADGVQVEYLVVCLDDPRKVVLSLRQSDILKNLEESTDLLKDGGKDVR